MEDQFRRYYPRTDFVALVGSLKLAVFVTELRTLNLAGAEAFRDVRMLPDGGAVVEWEARPADATLTAVNGKVAGFTGGSTSSAPIEINSFGNTTASNATPVNKISQTTPALDAGTYQVIWNCVLKMQSEVAGEGAKGLMTVTRSDNVSLSQVDHWEKAVEHAFNGALPFVVTAGQTIAVLPQGTMQR
jgi:hypothetical protein